MEKTLIKTRTLGIGKFIIKHWYLFLFLFFTIPIIINSIQTAIQTNNPSYPFIQLGLSIVDSDFQLSEKISYLELNPIGIKPEGIWNGIKYYFGIFLIIWEILGLLFMITIPFFIFYKLFRWRDSSAGTSNFFKAIIFGFIFIFIINLILVIYGLVNGTIIIPGNDTDIYSKTWEIIKLNIPFRGFYSLIKFLIKLAN
ncbi:MAG: hypothetical protein WC979_09930 [Candidatus Pacearchaeota archaeon]|jgi:hypothetical protein